MANESAADETVASETSEAAGGLPRPQDEAAARALIEQAVAEVPEWAELRGMQLRVSRNLLLWPLTGEPAGFAAFQGEGLRVLGPVYLVAAQRHRLGEMLHDVVGLLHSTPGTLAIGADAACGPFSLESPLTSLGFEAVRRFEVLQDLEAVDLEDGNLDDGNVEAPARSRSVHRLQSWRQVCSGPDASIDRAALLDAAARLVADANQGTIDGLFLCLPGLPTASRCRLILEQVAASEHGPFLEDASGLLFAGHELVGLVLALQSGQGESFLFELAVARAERAQGMARRLVRHLQRASLGRGLRRMRFFYCSSNAAVRALFCDREVLSCTGNTVLFWRSPAYRGGIDANHRC